MGSPRRAPLARLRRRAASRDADARVRRALVDVLDRELDAAEAALRDVVADDSDEHEVYLALARIYRTRGEVGRAIRVHQNLLLRGDLPRETRLRALRGIADDFVAGGFLRRAIAAWEELLGEAPDDVAGLATLLRLLREAREPRRALEVQRRLRRLGPLGPLGRRGRRDAGARRDEAALWVEVAEQARHEGDADGAERAARRATRIDPESPRAWALRAELEGERGRARKALAAWRRAAQCDPRGAAALEGPLARAFAAAGRPGDHEALLRELLAQAGGAPELRLALARALDARGARDEAAAELRAVVEADPEHLEAWRELGRVESAAGRGPAALRAYEGLAEAAERRGLLRARERGVE